MNAFYGWRPYIPVARRQAQAKREVAALRKQGVRVQPIVIAGRTIASTFWGKGWCTQLESFSDYENRLPRGRTYVRNGSVCHLEITSGKVVAKVVGYSLYDVVIRIKTLPAKKWEAIKKQSAGQIGSLLELLQGKLSTRVMQIVTHPNEGLFPQAGEISLGCSCPDWARMCKHVAAVLYGVGARLDVQPELLFTLRGVDHQELIDADAALASGQVPAGGSAKRLSTDGLGEIFGIDLDAAADDGPAASPPIRKKARATRKAATVRQARETPAAEDRRPKTRKKAAKKTAKRERVTAAPARTKPAATAAPTEARRAGKQTRSTTSGRAAQTRTTKSVKKSAKKTAKKLAKTTAKTTAKTIAVSKSVKKSTSTSPPKPVKRKKK